MPQNVCKKCVADIGAAVAYRQKCERSNFELRKMLKQQRESDLVKLEGYDEAIACDDAETKPTNEHWFVEIEPTEIVPEIDLKTEDARMCAEVEESTFQMDFDSTSAHSFDSQMAAGSDGGRDFSDEMHGEREKTDGNGSKEKKYTCEICSKVFNRKYNWKQHKLVHSDEKNFLCHTCNQEYKSKNNLK